MARLKPALYYYDIVRKNIRKYRLEAKLTQQKLSDLAEISMHFLTEIESTKKKKTFSIETVGKIADALEIPIAKLFEE